MLLLDFRFIVYSLVGNLISRKCLLVNFRFLLGLDSFWVLDFLNLDTFCLFPSLLPFVLTFLLGFPPVETQTKISMIFFFKIS